MLKLLKLRNRSSSDNQKDEPDQLEVVSEEGGEHESVKRAVIVHCWGGEPEYAWYPWAKKELESRGFKVDVPEMPDPEEPQLRAWLERLKDAVGEPDEDLVLIGHSLGCATVLRYLESLPEETKVGKVILVAAFTDQIGYREFDSFFKKPFDFEKIKRTSVNGFYIFQSNDDPYVTEQYGIRLEEDLDAELFIKNAAGHMSGPLDDKESFTEFPEVVEEALGVPLQSTKRKVSKALSKTAISFIVLAILLSGAGLGYTYYIDKQNSRDNKALNSAVDAANQQQGSTINPHKPTPGAAEGVALDVLSSPISRGQTAAMSVQTQPTSTCTIVVTYLGNVVAHDPGLVTKTADNFGSASWNWTISPTAPIGKGMAKVTCAFYKKSAMVEGDLQVTR